jgi:protein FAM32A
MSDEYAKVARGKLKLKTDGEISKKKKKKKDKEREREAAANVDTSTIQIVEPSSYERKLTKAEQSFKKMQDKMVSAAS